MRTVVILLTALFALTPVGPTESTDGDAHGAPKRKQQRAKKRSRPAAKKPVIKLKEPTTPAVDDAAAASSRSATPQRGPTRIDFDDRIVQGQTNRSGSVYLYDRKELKTRSMVQTRDSFRDEISGAVNGSR